MSVLEFHQSCLRLDGETDPQLGNYITLTKSMSALAAPDFQQSVAVGLKGIGKSSAFRYLTEFDKSVDVVVAVNADKYTLRLPAKALNFAACRKQFEQDLVVEALREFCKQAPKIKNKEATKLVSSANKYVDNYLRKLGAVGERIKGGGVSILGFGFTVQRGDAPTLVGLMADKDISGAREVLTKICQLGVTIRIVVDDPELVFSVGKSLDVHLVGGFCLAALRLSAAIPNLKVIGLLTSHVYHPVSSAIHDLSKYPNHLARLNWTVTELEQLVEHRLQNAGLKWTQLFDADSPDQAKKLLSIMTESVRDGPRDLLYWLYLALQDSSPKPITRANINHARKGASQAALKELERAHDQRFENVGEVIRAIFKDDPEYEFTPAEFRKHLQSLLVKDSRMKALSIMGWLQQKSSETLPGMLLEVGAISFRQGSRIILPYEEEYTPEEFSKAKSILLTPALVMAIQS